jgi:hypothetical protein
LDGIWYPYNILAIYGNGFHRFFSNGLNMVTLIIFVVGVVKRENFEMPNRVKVYDNLYAEANMLLPAKISLPTPPPPPSPFLASDPDFNNPNLSGGAVSEDPTPRWALETNHTGMKTLASEMDEIRYMAKLENLYWALQMVSMAFLVLRLFLEWEFQAKLSLVIKTLRNATVDLSHFFIVLGYVVFALSAVGNLVFGTQLVAFASLSSSLDTLSKFVVFMDYEPLKVISNMELEGGIALTPIERTFAFVFLFYVVLIFYFLMLNFLLVIIGDAMVAAHMEAVGKETMFHELYLHMQYSWRVRAYILSLYSHPTCMLHISYVFPNILNNVDGSIS